MVSISGAAPDASRICKVAAMISGPMPSPCATVIGVLVGKPQHTRLRRVSQARRGITAESFGEYSRGPRCHDLALAQAFQAPQVVITRYHEARPGSRGALCRSVNRRRTPETAESRNSLL